MDTHEQLLALEEEGVDLDLLTGRDHESAGVGPEWGTTKYTNDGMKGSEGREGPTEYTEDTEI